MKKEERRVGVEIEFGAVPPKDAADAVAEVFDATVSRETDAKYKVESSLGTFVVELDSRPLKRLVARNDENEPGELATAAQEVFLRLANEFVPTEIVAPPLARSKLPLLDEMVGLIGSRGGRGTLESVRFAFGVHFNPELLDLSADNIRKHLQAFQLLYPELLKIGSVDKARRASPFIDPFPEAYSAVLLSSDYRPSLEGLMADYLQHNPSRNRALDMLPMFAHLDESRVRAAIPDDEKVNPRPTFHFRLANSRVGDEGWKLSQEWRLWQLVELLAEDEARLQTALKQTDAVERDWIDQLKEALV